MPTDTTEKGLESLIMLHMTGTDGLPGAGAALAERMSSSNGNGWHAGSHASYDREFAVDTEQLFAFLRTTQPEEYVKLGMGDLNDSHGIPFASQSCPITT